jgi:hypothetical protein
MFLFLLTIWKEKQQILLASVVCVVDEDFARLKSIADAEGFASEQKDLHFLIFRTQNYALSQCYIVLTTPLACLIY